MSERFGKPVAEYLRLQQAFYDLAENDKLVAALAASDRLYRGGPARAQCKLCAAALAGRLFRRAGIDYSLCPSCGHLNGHYQDTEAYNLANYDDHGTGHYASIYQDQAREAYDRRRQDIYEPKVAFLIDALRAAGEQPEQLAYADFGAGTGHLVAAMLAKGLTRVAGYEVSQAQVDLGNRMIGRELMAGHGLAETLVLAANVQADVVSSVFHLEHVADPLGLMLALRGNARVRYLLLAVPLFSPATLLQLVFPEVMPRVLGLGHTHLFTPSSLRWLFARAGVETLAEWWFGGDMVDLHRSVGVHLAQKPELAPAAPAWHAMILSALDELQLAIDRAKLSSEVHLVLRFGR